MSSLLLLLVAQVAGQTDASSEVFQALAPTQGGLTTAEVVERALETSPQLSKATAIHLRAKVEADFAFLAYAPRIDGSVGYFRQTPFTFPNFDNPAGPPIEIKDGLTIAGRVSIPASDYFLTIIHGYEATITAEEVARHNLRAQREAVALGAVQTFVDSVRAKATMFVAKKSVDVLSGQLEDLRRLADAGLQTEGDVLQVKAQVANTKVALEKAIGAVAVTEESLRRTLHTRKGELAHGEDLLAAVALPVPSFDDALAEALAQRPEVLAMKRLISAREDQVLLNFGTMFPRLTVDADISHSKPNQRTFDFDSFTTFWTVGLNLVWSPNDFVFGYSETEKAEEDVDAARADLAVLTDAIAIEVASAVSGWRATRASIAAAKEGVEAAEGSFADRKQLLDAGTGTTRELLLSEQDLRRAQLQLINAHLDLRLARAQLDRALGRLAQEATP